VAVAQPDGQYKEQASACDAWQTPGDKAAANPGIARALPFSIDPIAVAIPATNQSEPPARLTAPASLPPDTRSIAASRIGCSIPSVCVKRF
jgi:hypothetical protein